MPYFSIQQMLDDPEIYCITIAFLHQARAIALSVLSGLNNDNREDYLGKG